MRTSLLAVAALVAASGFVSAQTPDLYDEGTLRSIYLTFSSSTWYSDLVASRKSGAYVKAGMVVDKQLYQQVGVRMTGNSSFDGTSSQKKPLAISVNEYVSGQSLLGYTNINLSNGFNDPTMMREVIGYGVLRKYVPSPKCNWVKVYINNTYWGLYVNVQQVDKHMVAEWFKDNSGNRYFAESPTSAGNGNTALQDLGTTLQNYKDAYELKNDVTSAVKPWEDIRNLCQVLSSSKALSVDLPKIADYDQFLWYLAFYNVVANLDGYNSAGEDYFLYHDTEHDLITVLPWDMEGAFGASPAQTVTQAINQSPFLNSANSSLPLLGKLWGQTEWRARYVHHMRTLMAEVTSTNIASRVNTHAALISAALKADTNSLYSYQTALTNTTQSVSINSGTYAKTVPGLKQFCDGRLAYLATLTDFKVLPPTVSNVKATPTDPKPATPVVVTASVAGSVGTVTLHYRSVGGWVATPMYDDGKHGDGGAADGVFGGVVPAAVHTPGANVRFYVGAEAAATAGGAVAYSPANGQIDALRYVTQWAIGTSPVSINEVMADNTRTVQDSAGEYDDWIELYNSSNSAVTIGGMYLTDDTANPTRWQFPTGTQIPAKSVLLVWCDDDANQGPLHTTFKLSAKGELISLFDTDGKTRLSRITFGPMAADESIGNLLDGQTSHLVAYRKYGTARYGVGPTPGKTNEPASGAREYWPLDSSGHRMFVEWAGEGRINTTNVFRSLGGPASSAVVMMIASAPAEVPIGSGLNLMIGGVLTGPYYLKTDSSGQAIVVIYVPNDSTLVGVKAFFQVGGADATGFTLSNGAEIVLGK